MKRVGKFCWHHSGTNVAQPCSEHTAEPQLESPKESESESKLSEKSKKIQKLAARRHYNAFSVMKARFLPDDDIHSVVISFGKDGGTEMKLTVDGKMMYQVNTAGNFRGNVELSIEGLVVDFSWDVARIPMKFGFRTREFSFHAGASGSSGGGGGGGGGGEQWKDSEEAHYLEILAT